MSTPEEQPMRQHQWYAHIGWSIYVSYPCWLHGTASTYKTHTLEGQRKTVHRIAYEILVGEIPEGLVLDHLCQMKNCYNPAHLEPVTERENRLRAWRIKRGPR